jgi:hypothetical protein
MNKEPIKKTSTSTVLEHMVFIISNSIMGIKTRTSGIAQK